MSALTDSSTVNLPPAAFLVSHEEYNYKHIVSCCVIFGLKDVKESIKSFQSSFLHQEIRAFSPSWAAVMSGCQSTSRA